MFELGYLEWHQQEVMRLDKLSLIFRLHNENQYVLECQPSLINILFLSKYSASTQFVPEQ